MFLWCQIKENNSRNYYSKLLLSQPKCDKIRSITCNQIHHISYGFADIRARILFGIHDSVAEFLLTKKLIISMDSSCKPLPFTETQKKFPPFWRPSPDPPPWIGTPRAGSQIYKNKGSTGKVCGIFYNHETRY